MTISYKKLWKLLIDKDMKKKYLQKAVGISSDSLLSLRKQECKQRSHREDRRSRDAESLLAG